MAAEENPIAIELVEKGKKLIEKAKTSDLSTKHRLVVQGLKCFLGATAKQSRDAVSRMKTLFSDLSDSAIDELPTDLKEMAHLLIRGSETEKEVYAVAKDMFETMAQGKDFICKDDIGEAVERLLATKKEDTEVEKEKLRSTLKKLLNCCLSTNDKGIIVTEDKFCLTACHYSQGEADLLDSVEAEGAAQLTSEELDSFKKSNWFKKVTTFPTQTLRHIYRYVLQYIERYGLRWVWSLFPLRQFFLLLFIYIVPLINIQFMLSTLATLFFFICLMAMVVSTIQVIANSSKVKCYKEYSVLFSEFAKDEEEKDAIMNNRDFILSSALPYITYTVTGVLGYFLMGLAFKEALIYEVLVIIAGAMSSLVFFQFSCWKSPLMLLAVSTRLLSWGLVFLYMFHSWIPIPGIFFISGWTLLSIPIFPGFWIGINFTSLIQVPLHTLVVLYYCYRYSWKNLFNGLGPYLMFISWWLFCRSIFTHSSIVSLFFFGPGILACLIFLPFLPILIVTAPLVILFYHGFTTQLFLSLLLLLFVSVASVLFMKYYRHLKESETLKLNINLNYIVVAQFLIGAILFVAGTVYYNSPPKSSFAVISFEDYNKLCGVNANMSGNFIQNQLNCQYLKSSIMTVENAQVIEVKMGEITNGPLTMLSNFPDSVRNALTCLMGETKPFCGKNSNSKTCAFKGCHFDSKNQYNILILTRILSSSETTATLSVWVSHQSLLNNSFLLKLKAKDIISFNATLEDGLGTSSLHLKLLSYKLNNEVYDMRIEGVSEDESKKKEILKGTWGSFVATVKLLTEILFGYSSSEYYKP